jgi:PAS domain S-box-containing protein
MEPRLPTGLPSGQLTVLAAAALDSAGDLIGFLAVDGAVLYANRAVCRELQIPAELALRATIFDFLPALTPELWAQRWTEFRGGGRLRFVDVMRRADGTIFMVDVHASLVTVDGAELALVVARDITESRRAGRALRESAETFRALTENNPALVTRWGPDHRVMYANPAAAAVGGHLPGELVGRTAADLLDDAVAAARIDEALERVFGEGVPVATDLVLYGRSFVWHVAPELGEHGEVASVLGVSTEVTEQKALERELRESRDFIAQVIASDEEGIVVVDRELRYLIRNRFMEELTGIPSADLLGVSVVERTVPQLGELIRYIEAALAGETVRSRDIKVLVRPGIAETWVQTTYSPLRDAAGAITGVIMVVHDVTMRRRAEQERRELEVKLLETQKLESLGVLASGVAHDFNNLLVGILGNASLAAAEPGLSSSARERLQEIELSARRAADLTRQLLTYAGRGRGVIVPLDVSELFAETIDLVRAAVPRSVQLEISLDPALPAVVADRSQLQQVVMNLVINAGEAVGDSGGTVRVTTRSTELGVQEAAGIVAGGGELAAGSYVVFEVSDTGAGMDAETVARVFEPFFSTKGSGRGLGLSSVLGIVRGHRGALRVESRQGEGATFRVLLPVSLGAVVAGPRQDGSAGPAGGPQAWPAEPVPVLLVEDEQAVARTVRRMLEVAGYSVTVASEGHEALSVLRARPDTVRAVVLDLTMPGLSGAETYRELRLLDRSLPVLVTSGYADGDDLVTLDDDPHAAFLAKPYRPDELALALALLLGGAAPAPAPAPGR